MNKDINKLKEKNDDIENGEKLLTKISELIEFYSAEPWIEDTLDKTILPSKYDFS